MEKVTTLFKNVAMGSLTKAFEDINPRRLSLQSDLRQSGSTYRRTLVESVEKIFKEKMNNQDGLVMTHSDVSGFNFNTAENSIRFDASLVSPKTFEAQYVVESPEMLAYLRNILFITYWPVIVSEIANKILIEAMDKSEALAIFPERLEEIVQDNYPLLHETLPSEIYRLLIATFLRMNSYRIYTKGSINNKFREFLKKFLKGEITKVAKGAKEGNHLFFHDLRYQNDDSLYMIDGHGVAIGAIGTYRYFGKVDHRPLARSTGIEMIQMNAKNRYGHIIGEDISMIFDPSSLEFSSREAQSIYHYLPSYLNFTDLKDEWHIAEDKSKEFVISCMNITKSGLFVSPESGPLADEALRDQIKGEMFMPIIMYLMYKGYAFLHSWVRSYDYRAHCEFWTMPRVWTHIDGSLPILVTEDVDNLMPFAPIASVLKADDVKLELTANEMINPEVVRRKANLAAESLALSLSIG